MFGRLILFLILVIPCRGADLQGSVKILDRDGKPRPNLKDCVAILEPASSGGPKRAPQKPLSIRTYGKQFVPRIAIVTPGTEVVFPDRKSVV